MNLETKYYKDLNHNFLVLKGENGEKNDYRSKMITGNHIKNLLSCRIQNMNGEIFFSYEISSKQNMKQFFDRQQMNLSRLLRLFESLSEASKEIKNYLLEDSRIILEPEFIFLNPETEEYIFVYYPYDYEWDQTMQLLGDFLVEKVDHEDEKAVEIAYKVYEHILNHTFILSEILGLFPGTKEGAGKEISREEVQVEEVRTSDKEADIPYVPVQSETETDFDTENGVKGEKEQKISSMTSAILLILSVAATAGIFAVRYLFILTVEEALLTMTGIAVLTVVSALLFLFLIMRVIGKKKEKSKLPEKQFQEGTVKEPDSDCRWGKPQEPWQQIQPFMKETALSQQENEEQYGKTVFLETVLSCKENKLYGINKGNKYHIDLNSLPCTIGKMAGGVDIMIKDDSISRIHARFTKNGETILVTDLNSTNGTFKNGLRLEPQETIAIEPGDEIRFGKMAFCYR